MTTCDKSEIINNTCSNNGKSGFCFSSDNDNEITNNFVDSNKEYGMYLSGCDFNNIRNNSINNNNESGLYLRRCTYNNMINNTIKANRNYAFILDDECAHNTIFNNSILNNNIGSVQAYDNGLDNKWDNSNNRGNFWSDYAARYPEALNNRWIWNIPYDINGSSGEKDNFPLCAAPSERESPILESDNSPNSANTGDIFSFVSDFSDNYFVTYVTVFYSFNQINYYHLSMSNVSEKRWVKDIIVPLNSTNLHYYYFAVDAARNFLVTPLKSIPVIDNDRPIFVKDDTHIVPTTGDNFTFSANFSDNINVKTVLVHYSFDSKNFLSEDMENIYDEMWSTSIRIESNASNLSYHFHFEDESNNYNSTNNRGLRVYDNDPPKFLKDNSSSIGTTGDDFTFSINLGDNIAVTKVFVKYSFDRSTYHNISMGRTNEATWSLTISIDHGAIYLDYSFYFEDFSGNFNISPAKSVDILDNDPPVFIADNTLNISTTGDNFTFSAKIFDNIEIVSAWVHYIINNKSDFRFNLTPKIDNTWIAIITMPVNATNLKYYYSFEDSSGNFINSSIINLSVLDNDAPISEAGEDKSIRLGDEVVLNGSESSDNIGVINYTWSFMFKGTDISLYGPIQYLTFDMPGNYTIALDVFDEYGNKATDKLNIIVFVWNTSEDDDLDESDDDVDNDDDVDDDDDVDNDDTNDENDEEDNNDDDTENDSEDQYSDSHSKLPFWIIIPLILVTLTIVSLILLLVIRRKRKEDLPSKEMTVTEVPSPPERKDNPEEKTTEVTTDHIDPPLPHIDDSVETVYHNPIPTCPTGGLLSKFNPENNSYRCESCPEHISTEEDKNESETTEIGPPVDEVLPHPPEDIPPLPPAESKEPAVPPVDD